MLPDPRLMLGSGLSPNAWGNRAPRGGLRLGTGGGHRVLPQMLRDLHKTSEKEGNSVKAPCRKGVEGAGGQSCRRAPRRTRGGQERPRGVGAAAPGPPRLPPAPPVPRPRPLPVSRPLALLGAGPGSPRRGARPQDGAVAALP